MDLGCGIWGGPPDIVIVIDADCAPQTAPLDTWPRPPQQFPTGRSRRYNLMVPLSSPFNYRSLSLPGGQELGAPARASCARPAVPADGHRHGVSLAGDPIRQTLPVANRRGPQARARAGSARMRTGVLSRAGVTTSSRVRQGRRHQRQRWEHGHIPGGTAPGLIVRAIASSNWRLLALTLDMAVPPLGLLGLLMWAAAGGCRHRCRARPLVRTTLCQRRWLVSAWHLAALLSWLTFGRDILPPAALLSLAPFHARKATSLRPLDFSRTCLSVDQDGPQVAKNRAGCTAASVQHHRLPRSCELRALWITSDHGFAAQPTDAYGAGTVSAFT